MAKFTKKTITTAAKPIILLPFHDAALSAVFANADSAGLAAEYLVKNVLGQYGKRLGKVVSVTPQSYNKFPNFRGTRVDVVCLTDNNELWLIEFQMYDDEFIFERNLVELSYTVIKSTTAGTTVEEMAEDIPHIVVINFLNFLVRSDNLDWLQPAHVVYDKEPRQIAYEKVEIFNIQLPWFAEHEPDFDDDGECWLYVMYQAHIRKITPQEMINLDSRLDRFATTNPGFQQFETRFLEASANPDVLDLLRMEASERIRQAGMRKAIEKKGEKKAAKETALRMINRNYPIEDIVEITGLTTEAITALQAAADK
jgi:predicted transposase/invertase (TIGR01784 family)